VFNEALPQNKTQHYEHQRVLGKRDASLIFEAQVSCNFRRKSLQETVTEIMSHATRELNVQQETGEQKTVRRQGMLSEMLRFGDMNNYELAGLLFETRKELEQIDERVRRELSEGRDIALGKT
jgi:hypothetical protein